MRMFAVATTPRYLPNLGTRHVLEDFVGMLKNEYPDEERTRYVVGQMFEISSAANEGLALIKDLKSTTTLILEPKLYKSWKYALFFQKVWGEKSAERVVPALVKTLAQFQEQAAAYETQTLRFESELLATEVLKVVELLAERAEYNVPALPDDDAADEVVFTQHD